MKNFFYGWVLPIVIGLAVGILMAIFIVGKG